MYTCTDWCWSRCVGLLVIPSVVLGLTGCGNGSGSPVAVVPEDPFAVSLPLMAGEIRITEFIYAANDGEFIEFTNVGSNPIDVTGWSFDDDSRTPGTQDLSGFGVIQPGESVILTESGSAAFRDSWRLCDGIKVLGGLTANLGRNDEINLFDDSGSLVDRLTYGDQAFPGTIRAQNSSGFVSAAGLGTNDISEWSLSTVGDAENSVTSTGGDVGSPGQSTRATVSFDPCNVAPGTPVIAVDPSTTNFLDLPATGSGSVSGVIGDPTDPASTLGIKFALTDNDTPLDNLIVTASSSNQAVVSDANLILTGSDGSRTLTITPTGVGFSAITVTVSDGTNSGSYLISYASSAASVANVTRFHSGACDASTAVAVDGSFMLVADDEDQTIRLYDRNNSGFLLNSFDFNSVLNLTDVSGGGNIREVDIEGSARSGDTIYWIGSHSNSSGGADRPNRERIFSTTLSGSGVGATLSFNGFYQFLEDDLIAFDNNNGSGLGAGALGLAASAASGVIPEEVNGSGFNIEGLTFAPDGTTAYVGFRAPLQTPTSRDQALIIPVTNFTTLPGHEIGSATFGSPIFLNLGGRAIRSIERNSTNQYLIVAGTAGADNDFRLYIWTGDRMDEPIEVAGTDLTALNAGGSFESIVEVPVNLGNGSQVQLLVDNGDTDFYDNGEACKDLAEDTQKKFRSEVVTLSGIPQPGSGTQRPTRPTRPQRPTSPQRPTRPQRPTS